MNYVPESAFKETIYKKLSELPDKPKGLYTTGDEHPLSGLKLITIVGSRACSTYGKEITKKIISDLSGYPVCIISGLALGIDYVTHTSALNNSIPTIAFPGSGLDQSVIYPASHKDLAKQIVAAGGLLVSEYEPETKAARWTFPKRNRLMAGMADLVIVIEAGEKSGTLITARLAAEYNTDVAVIPQNIDHLYARGSNKLMQEGAFPILDYTDILSLLQIHIKEKLSEKNSYTNEHQHIIANLSEPKTKNELYKLSGLTYQKFIESISILEIESVIKGSNNKIYLL